MSHELWFLRHGQSVGNQQGIRQGQRDYPLTDHGRHQIQQLAKRWQSSDQDFNQIISSPLTRARQSAEIIAQALAIGLEFDDNWKERHSGQAEGKQLVSGRKDDASRHHAPAHAPSFPQGESRLDLHIRACSGLQKIMDQPPGRYLIVAHGGVMNAALHAILGLSPSGQGPLPRFIIDNGAFSVADYDPARGHWSIVVHNLTY